MKTKFKKLNSCLTVLLCAGTLLAGLASCANDAGGSDYIADNGGDHYFGINGGTSGGATGGSGTGGTATSPNSSSTSTGRIGTKASPNAVGDIVFSDGSATAYNDASFDFAAHQSDAVAVIFDAVSKKGIGLACCQKIWSTHHINAALNIYGSQTDGSGNYTILYNRATTYNSPSWGFPISPAAMETAFPVMYWVHNYSVSGYTNGWYLPAKDELELILQNVTELEQALSKVNGFTIGNKDFWTSSIHPSTTGADGVYYEYYDYSNNNVEIYSTEYYGGENGNLFYGIPVHVFN